MGKQNTLLEFSMEIFWKGTSLKTKKNLLAVNGS